MKQPDWVCVASTALSADPDALHQRCDKILVQGTGGQFRCTFEGDLCMVCGWCVGDREDYLSPAKPSAHCQCTLDDVVSHMNNLLPVTPIIAGIDPDVPIILKP